jgi:hypothetical protein
MRVCVCACCTHACGLEDVEYGVIVVMMMIMMVDIVMLIDKNGGGDGGDLFWPIHIHTLICIYTHTYKQTCADTCPQAQSILERVVSVPVNVRINVCVLLGCINMHTYAHIQV